MQSVCVQEMRGEDKASPLCMLTRISSHAAVLLSLCELPPKQVLTAIPSLLLRLLGILGEASPMEMHLSVAKRGSQTDP